MMYSRTVTMCKARHLRKYIFQEIGYNVEFQFDYNIDEVKATFSCSDDYADITLCHNADDLEEYIIKRYGAFLIKEDIPNPKNFNMTQKKIGEVLTNPQLNKRDNYQDYYYKILTMPEWRQWRSDNPDIYADERISKSGYDAEYVKVRLGLWHG